MESDKKFIITQDKETAQRLIDLGFSLFSQNDNTYIFENSSCRKYADCEIGEVVYTNRVFI